MRFIREPLLHFVLLGVALFALAHVARRHDASASSAIVVSAGRIDHLAAAYARTWQRPPTDEELQRLIADDVREEVLYREALALGLDRDDTIIRRRLRQKMEFLAETDAAVEPDDGELARYLAQHADAYRLPERVSFRHVYIDPQRHGDRLAAEIERLRAALDGMPAGTDRDALGDPFLLPGEFHDVTARDVSGTFGDAFAARLGDLPLGRWDGPVTSGYGVHLVRVDARSPGRDATLDEVRDPVRRDLANERRLAANEALVRRLLERYTVEIERTGAGPVVP
jgi:hypothetical protein